MVETKGPGRDKQGGGSRSGSGGGKANKANKGQPSAPSGARTRAPSPSTAFFSALADEDFFSDRVQHLYFYEEVTHDSVAKLQQDIHLANQATSVNDVLIFPRPIVLHVNSPGGDVSAAMSMLTIFNQTRVPLCTMTDGFSASAATFLTIASPYRVAATPHVYTLIHQYTGLHVGTQAQLRDSLALSDTVSQSLVDIYLACTTLKPDQLQELMLRDRFLDTDFCTRFGIFDRVLDVKNGPALASYRRQKAEYLDLPLRGLLSKPNWNRFVFSTCKGDVQRLDAFLCAPAADTKPIIYYCTPRCEYDAFYWLAMVARMKAMRVPVYSVIESIVDIWHYLPSLFCMKRYMYVHGIVVIDMQYEIVYGNRLVDIRENTDALLGMLRTVLRQKTRIPEEVLRGLGDRRYTFDAAKCLEYGLCDEVVALNHHRA